MLRVLWSWLQYIHLSQVVYTCSGLCPTTFLTNAWPNLKKRFMGGLNLLHPNLANLHCQKKATWIITGMAHEFMVCHRLSWKDMPHTPTNQAIPVRDHTSIDEWNAFLLCRILLHSSVPAAHRWQMAHWSKNRSNSTLPKQTHVNSAGQGGPTLALVTPRRQDLHHSNHCRSETCQADIFLWTGLARDWEGNRGKATANIISTQNPPAIYHGPPSLTTNKTISPKTRAFLKALRYSSSRSMGTYMGIPHPLRNLILRLVIHRALRSQLAIQPSFHQQTDHSHRAHGQLSALPKKGID